MNKEDILLHLRVIERNFKYLAQIRKALESSTSYINYYDKTVTHESRESLLEIDSYCKPLLQEFLQRYKEEIIRSTQDSLNLIAGELNKQNTLRGLVLKNLQSMDNEDV